jgi:hypothetical protein
LLAGGSATVAPEATTAVEERQVSCGGRTYVLRRFPDKLVAIYDTSGKLLAGWPLTALWPDLALSEQTEEQLCANIQRSLKPY